MEKVKIDTNAFIYPMPMSLVGAMVDGRPNFLAVAWVSRLNYKPPYIGVALGNSHYTNKGIVAQGVFSVNIPSVELAEKTDFCGIVSGAHSDKSTLFRVTPGPLGSPLIEQCPVSMECVVVKTVEMPQDTLFIGEIKSAYATKRIMTDGKPDMRKIKPFVLSMPDNRYWTIGAPLGPAWNIGRKLRGRPRET